MPELLPGLFVAPETHAHLQAFANALARWSERINLIAPSTKSEIWWRHICDCAQLWAHAPPSAKTWVDLGSGAGLPGLVIAILGAPSNLAMTLVEPDQRKAAFLRTQSALLGLTTRILTARAELVPPLAADVVSARALAPLPKLLPLVRRHLRPDGFALLPKGSDCAREVETARAFCNFHLDALPSVTDPNARILRLRRLESKG